MASTCLLNCHPHFSFLTKPNVIQILAAIWTDKLYSFTAEARWGQMIMVIPFSLSADELRGECTCIYDWFCTMGLKGKTAVGLLGRIFLLIKRITYWKELIPYPPPSCSLCLQMWLCKDTDISPEMPIILWPREAMLRDLLRVAEQHVGKSPGPLQSSVCSATNPEMSYVLNPW